MITCSRFSVSGAARWSGACDLEPLMAQQLCERYQIKQAFSDVAQLLDTCRPDVVHITTPPQGHFDLGKQCLEAGCHVYVEKPFALDRDETEELLDIAEEKSLKVTVGHDLQFSSRGEANATARARTATSAELRSIWRATTVTT